MSAPRCLLLLVVGVLCVARCTAQSPDHLEGTLPLIAYGHEVEQAPSCMNTLLACKAACYQQADRVEHYLPAQRPEMADLIARSTVITLLTALALAVSWALWATMQLSQERTRVQESKRREAELLHRCKGVQDQAFEYAKKLNEASPRPAASPGAAGVQSNVPTLQLRSPAGHACSMQTVDAAHAGHEPHSAASTPPAPASESSAPNLALLVAEAKPARDACNNSDQLAMPGVTNSALKASPGKSPAGHDRANHLQPPTPLSPGQPAAYLPQHQNVSASRTGPQPSGPAGRHSPLTSPSAVAPPAAAVPRMLPSGAVAVSAQAGSPASSYFGPRAAANSAQRVPGGSISGPTTWTPPAQQQQQHQAMSCPPMPAAGTPYGAGAVAAGPAPHSAGQLGGAVPGMPITQHKVVEPTLGQTLPPAAGLGGWVNTSRGSGTPLPFGATGPLGMQQQQQLFASPMAAGSPMAPGLCTPGTASTAQTAGSLTHVQSVHSTGGSCGGPARSPMSATPMSASSATSGARGSSAGSRSPHRLSEVQDILFNRMDDMFSRAQQLQKSKQELARLEQEKERLKQQVSPARPTASPNSIRQSPV